MAGVVFLAINSFILARGAAKWGLEPGEQISYAAVAATVPWVIAIMPFLVVMSWKPGRWLGVGRPSLGTLVGCIVWLAFVTYNLVGAAGSVAGVRSEVISTRSHEADKLEAIKDARKRLMEEYAAIPKHRPAGTVEPLAAAERTKSTYEQTESCKDIRRRHEQAFCTNLAKLDSEVQSSKRAFAVQQELARLDAQLAAHKPTGEKVDPQARMIHVLTGLDEAMLTERLPVATPIVLELGSMTLLAFAFMLFGLNHRDALAGRAPGRQIAPPIDASPLQARDVAAPVAARPEPFQATALPSVIKKQLSTLTRQMELAEWFFRTCTRPMASGSLTERDWYRHYVEVCEQSSDTPLPLAEFRGIAARFVPSIAEVQGVVYYKEVLPLIPRRVA